MRCGYVLRSCHNGSSCSVLVADGEEIPMLKVVVAGVAAAVAHLAFAA
jgi:hypothetical protein